MTKSDQSSAPRSFATTYLPWVLAGVALLFYLITLNRWTTLQTANHPPLASNALAETARLSGWTWQPAVTEPVYWLVTLPLTLLPAAKVPLALNILAAVCAALALGLLGRTVSLLPQNRTEEQRVRQSDPQGVLSIGASWLPPVVAVILCGLELSFWENATSASGEMFNLLMFAYVARSLAEYRVSENQNHLYRACFVFAAAMTNNWGMIALAPVFLVSLIWLKGLSFLSGRFLVRMFLFGFAGLCFYLLLPIVAASSHTVEISFWQTLKHNLGSQKGLLMSTFSRYTLFFSDRPLWVLALSSLFPVLLISIRWPSYFADPSRLGVALSTLILHFAHAVLFTVCLWVMLDSQISARQLVSGTPLLSTYYLCALSIGYFAGYMVLVFGSTPVRRQRVELTNVPALNFLLLGIGCAMLVLFPVLQLYRNLPVIEAVNGKPFGKGTSVARDYAEAISVALPRSGGIVMSDDIRKLTLVRSLLSQRGTAERFLFLDTASLKWAEYHAFLEKTQPRIWKNFVPPGTKGLIAETSLFQILAYLSQSNTVHYLHPSFGYYFEVFYAQPQGVAYGLRLYGTNSLLPPKLSQNSLKYNQDFWVRADEKILQNLEAKLRRQRSATKSGGLNTVIQKLKLQPQANRDLDLIGSFYSRSRNYWAVEMQKAGSWPEAEPHLRSALELNPQNVVARMNLEYNLARRAGPQTSPNLSGAVNSLAEKYRSWDQLLNDNGPFDQPELCFEQGRMFLRGSLYRQAAEELTRSIELAPDYLPPRLWLAQLYVVIKKPEEALSIAREIRSHHAFNGGRSNALELLSIEGTALLQAGQNRQAFDASMKIVNQDPQNLLLLSTAAQTFLNGGDFTNAMPFIDRTLKLSPTNTAALVNKAVAYINTERYTDALPYLNQALEIDTDPKSQIHESATFNRAIALLQSGRLEEAEQDYETMRASHPKAPQIYYGLGEIAYRKKDMAAAQRNYETYLLNAPPNTKEAEAVRERLKEIISNRP